MTRLQKNPPASYANGSAPLQTAVPYENLPQSTQQPVPATSAVVPSSFNELPSTNPFSPNFTPRPAPSSAAQPAPAAQIFSPVSPISDPQPVERVSQPRLHAPEPQRPNGNRKNVNLQRLDGKPYPATGHAEKGPKHVKVAKDMFDGALPPVYRRQASDPIKPGDVAQTLSNTHECESCGKKCAEGGSCTHCGKRKSSEPGPRAANASNHSRTVSTGVNSERSIASSSTAVQSSSSASQPCCTKCGRNRRPGSLGTPHVSATNSAQPNIRIQQAGLSIQPGASGNHNPIYPQIDVIPPSATTYRRTNTVPSPFTPYGDESPLVIVQSESQAQSPPKKAESRSFRNNSIVRSLSRRLSRRDKEKDKSSAPLPSQQLAATENQTGEQSAGRLINMISSAMQEPTHSRDQQYPKIEVGEPDRPGTPFSFVGERDESDAFDKKGDAQGSNDEYFPNQEDKLDVIPRPKSADPHHGRHLSPEDAELRPQITRFKSLRSGVNRVNQSISRSQSLKRLGSVKQAHHAWYVDGTDENAVPVF